MRSRLTFHPSRSSSTFWAIRGWILKNQVLWQRASSSKTKLELSPAPSGCPTLAVHRLRLQMKQRHARICKMASKSHSSFKNLWNMFIIQNISKPKMSSSKFNRRSTAMANEKLFSAKSQQPELLTLGVERCWECLLKYLTPKQNTVWDSLRSYLLSKC